MTNLEKILIVSITPYFLEKDTLWFEQNIRQILETRKTQSFFQDHTLYIKKNQNHNLSQLLRKLDEMGYEKVYQVSEPGEFSQRGGIIDVFPVNLNYAVRLEFLGNKVESIEKLPLEAKNEKATKEILKKRLKSQKLFSDLKGLKSGDYLVHLDHGVGKFSDFSYILNSKYYTLDYAVGDKLYVPVGLERKLSRYIGFSEPKISRLGSALWQRTKKKVKEGAEKLAKELLEIYAKREVATRPHYLADTEIDHELASRFAHEETPDQLQAIKDIKNDLEKNEIPMDRIVCGDVGFGKTEIALRAMVKAVNSGYQTALICPTTILSTQHYQNFKERLSNLPIRIGVLSRLQSKKEQKETLKDLKEGKIDIIIGTHRLLSNDVEFSASAKGYGGSAIVVQKRGGGGKNLGLLVIDDEQRFGVKQKEKFRNIRTSLDVLSLSATPIPRTLYLALSSLKNISLIQTPPIGRLPVKTFILPWQEEIIRKAIEKEIAHGGQVYYLHNRIETIETAKNFLENLVPKAKLGIAHGRLNEKELIKVMAEFSRPCRGSSMKSGQQKTIDVLVATTIIENGLDLPNVNTLIVADATRLGLAQAYQIRGRIGRSHIQAFAYFVYPARLSERAKMRLDALKEAEELGSGYRIALKDLEIRGAGNILGKEQSGNINKIGLNLYCQILSEAVDRLKTTRPAP